MKRLYNPSWFQGVGKKKSYFEGWYFKLVDKNRQHPLAVIPGISFDASGNSHAFIQVLDGRLNKSHYYRFSEQDFSYSRDRFLVSIAGNSFSRNALTLDLEHVSGTVTFQNTVPWPVHWYSPGIMGPFAFAPFMECYHGIVSMDHDLQGTLELYRNPVDFGNGKGYAEKDWGSSFPSGYVWMQSNHFSMPGISLKCSVARIPWIGNAFNGFIAGLWLDGKLIEFNTYNRSQLKTCHITRERVILLLENPRYQLDVSVARPEATRLASPVSGAMEGHIHESMKAEIHAKLTDLRKKRVVMEDVGKSGGLEVAGDIDILQKS